MALPKIDSPIFELKLPSNGEKIKYRPFLVKEEKILLMAMDGKDEEESARAIKQVLTNCCLEDGFDVNGLPIFDIEYFFLQLRSRSMGESTTVNFKCEKCEALTPVSIDLETIEVKHNDAHESRFNLNSTVGIAMKYPTLDMGPDLMVTNEDDVDGIFKVIVSCIDYIFDQENIYSHKDTSKKELEEWLMTLTQDQFEKVKAFFETMPKLSIELDVTCKKCGHEDSKHLEGLQSFFA
tara:strand:+ start:43827 stop:44537 length:711 start_codon:yes stop_codon:yes gene_type:complete